MGVRALFDRYRSKALTGLRVQGRINRLKELNRFIRETPETREEQKTEAFPAPLEAAGTVE